MANAEAFIRSIEVVDRDAVDPGEFPWTLPAVAALAEDGLALDPAVTFLVGENGSGKSTLIEAFAVAAGLNAEGGSSNFSYSTRDSHSGLSRSLRLVRGAAPPADRLLPPRRELLHLGDLSRVLPRELETLELLRRPLAPRAVAWRIVPGAAAQPIRSERPLLPR